jgi:mycobactin polyketide synthetase MbtD
MTAWPDGRTPVLLSAHAQELIGRDAAALLDYVSARPAVGPAEVAAQLLRTRRVRRHRAVLRAADRAELVDALQALASGGEHPRVARSDEPATPRLAFVCPGQGSQWPSMGAEAYTLLPAYRAEADRCAEAFLAAGLASPLRYLRTAEHPDSFGENEIQGAQFVHAVALAAVWRSCGVVADLTIGHSLGEIAAAYLAGAITLADAVTIVGARAAVTHRMRGRYAVAALGISAEAAEELIAETPGWLELSVINAKTSVAVSGDRDAVATAVDTATRRGVFARALTVNFPVHTSVLDRVRAEFCAGLPQHRFAEGPTQFIGGATGDVVAAGTEFADYWYANLRHRVRFDLAVDSAVRCGARAFVELSAHPALLFAMGDTLDDHPGLPAGPAVLVGSGHRDAALPDRLADNIAAAAVADARYRWTDVVGKAAPLRDFPPAPMRATHMWVAPHRSAPAAPPADALSVSLETWRPLAPATPSTPRRVALITPEPQGPGAAVLRAALERHPVLSAAAPEQADMLVVVAPALHHADAGTATAALTARVGAGLLDYAGAAGPRTRDVWLLTAGAEHVVPGDAGPLPAQAALAAMHRSIGFEHPDQTFRHLDLPGGGLTADAATAALDALLTDVGEVALRGPGPALYHQVIEETTAMPPALALDTGLLDEVVITGGLGAIGRHYAHYLAAHGARRIVLLSRRGAEPRTLGALAATPGVEVIAPPCDLTDRDQVAAAAAEFAGAGASLLVHAAGAAGFATREYLDDATLSKTFAAKVHGLDHLTELWPLRADARILLCSSVSGVWGGLGHAAYSAANRTLDAMAARLRADGRAATSVRWGLWEAGGIVDAEQTAQIERSGLRPMAPRAAVEASLRDHPVDPLVLRADRDRLRLFLASRQAAAHESPAVAADTGSAVRAELAAVLSLPDAAAIDLGTTLFDLGVDSLLAIDLRKRIKTATGRTVPLARLLSGITGAELIADLDRRAEPADRAEKERLP